MAGTVGFAGVCFPETPGLDSEPIPGLVYRGRGRLRVSSNAEMACQNTLPTLTQDHTLPVANATCGVLGAAPGGGSIGSGFIGLASATMVAESDETVFVREIYILEINDSEDEFASWFMGHEADDPVVIPTPTLLMANAQAGVQSTSPSIRVGHIFDAADATQGHIAGNSGFGAVVKGANATMDYAASPSQMFKRILVANVTFNPDSSTGDGRRLFVTAGANATMGHVATPSGVTDNFVNTVPAIQGHTATPSKPVILHRTFPHASTDGMIVTAPTMSQNVVDQETGVTAASIFGTGISTTSEAGIPIGNTGTHPNTTAVAIRFKAKRTTTVESATVSLRGGTALSFGSPVLEARILRDDNTSEHEPVDSQRSGVTVNGTMVTYTGTSAHVGSVSDPTAVDPVLGRYVFTWSSGAPSLVRNVLYHLELRNIHSDPTNNFISLDTLAMSPVQSPAQPIVPDTDMAVLQRSTGGVWSAQSNTPVFSINYADGRRQGQGYLWAPNSPAYPVTGPLSRVRQTFVPTENLRVHKVAVRAGRWSGTQPLEIRVIRESNGAVLASAAADSGYFPLIDQGASDFRTSHRWYHQSFVSSFPVSAGVTASVELRTTAAAEYRVNHLDPQDLTLPASATFYQGRAQFTTDGGANWINASSRTTTTSTDLMFYLGLGSAAPSPVCSADSLTGLTIGQTTVVSARQLLANDTNPSGIHSATTNFPSGVNPLQLHLANSASNCAVVLSTANQTISISAKSSTGAFTYVARDIYGQRSSARVTFTAINDPVESSLVNWYGVPWNSHTAGNIIIRTNNTWKRFRAYQSGQIQSVRWWLRVSNVSGYSGGNGGNPRIRVFTNNSNGLPGTQVGTGSANHFVDGSGIGRDGGNAGQLMTFNTPVSVNEGTLYHLVWDNTNSSPSSNYFSVNCHNGPPLATDPVDLEENPGVEWPTAWAVGAGSVDRTNDRAPGMYAITYTNGFVQGCGYMDTAPNWVGGNTDGEVTGTKQVRQSFIPYASFTASQLGLCYARKTGSSALVCRIENSDGSLIEAVSFPAADAWIHLGEKQQGWVVKNLSQNRNFTQGTTYRLRMTTTTGTTYAFSGLTDGSHTWGYPRGMCTVNGNAQFSTNSGSSWSNWVHRNTTTDNIDLMFFFRIV